MSLQTPMTRREALTKMAVVMVTTSLLPYSNITYAEREQVSGMPVEYSQFLLISKKITALDDLDVALSARYFTALRTHFPQLSQHLGALFALSKRVPDANSLNQQATTLGLGEIMQAIVTAWYTGTVDPNNVEHSQLIAYKDALMYRTVQDALITPTWCTFGPLWWTDLPPGVHRQPSIPATDAPDTFITDKDKA